MVAVAQTADAFAVSPLFARCRLVLPVFVVWKEKRRLRRVRGGRGRMHLQGDNTGDPSWRY